ncbi:hypothetical protein AALP_AA1G119400 [Arabis alpina]|uniref:Uncharacterized protein n=1 Tax=Arabis alpina TaxID=50452 RepID=A0A087HMN5_ARAAL|nr:hypothetical protein AALP_AA1G119400 [Arabis alpina]
MCRHLFRTSIALRCLISSCLYEQHKLSKNDVKEILQEYHDNIGDLEGREEKEREPFGCGIALRQLEAIETHNGSIECT